MRGDRLSVMEQRRQWANAISALDHRMRPCRNPVTLAELRKEREAAVTEAKKVGLNL